MKENRMIEALVGAILVVFILIAILVVLGVVNSDGNYKEKESYSAYRTVVSEYTVHTGTSYSNNYPHYISWNPYKGYFERDYDATRHLTVIQGEKYSIDRYRD